MSRWHCCLCCCIPVRLCHTALVNCAHGGLSDRVRVTVQMEAQEKIA